MHVKGVLPAPLDPWVSFFSVTEKKKQKNISSRSLLCPGISQSEAKPQVVHRWRPSASVTLSGVIEYRRLYKQTLKQTGAILKQQIECKLAYHSRCAEDVSDS